jgi:hypothetical protein
MITTTTNYPTRQHAKALTNSYSLIWASNCTNDWLETSYPTEQQAFEALGDLIQERIYSPNFLCGGYFDSNVIISEVFKAGEEVRRSTDIRNIYLGTLTVPGFQYVVEFEKDDMLVYLADEFNTYCKALDIYNEEVIPGIKLTLYFQSSGHKTFLLSRVQGELS